MRAAEPAVDSAWTLRVQHFTVSKMAAVIPEFAAELTAHETDDRGGVRVRVLNGSKPESSPVALFS